MDAFLKRKQDVLLKSDKSSVGKWDEKIKELCEMINKKENYYTTSSCSGRVVLMKNQDKKAEGLFVKVWHDIVEFDEVMNLLRSQARSELVMGIPKNSSIKFKQEPCILHVACRTLEDAKSIYDLGKNAGWKKSGVISLKENNFVVELNSTEKLEFPVIEKGKLIVDEKFMKIVLKEANNNLKKSWEKIEKLGKLIQ